MDKRLTGISDPSVITPASGCKDLYFDLFNNMCGGLGMFELCGSKIRALYLNERYFDNVGYSRDQYRPYLDNITVTLLEEDERRLIAYSNSEPKGDAELFCEVRGYKHNGSLGWFSVRAKKLNFIDSDHPVFLASVNDISPQKDMEHQLSINRERYRILEETVSALLFEYKPFSDCMVFSVKGRKDHTIENYSMYLRRSDRLHHLDVNYYFNTLCKACRKPIKGFLDVRSYYSVKNAYLPYRIYYSSIADEFGSVMSVVGRIEPVGEENGTSAQIMANVFSGDGFGLTDPNSCLAEIEERISSGNNTGFLTIIDIDGFTPINETYGRKAGDSAVKATVKLLQEIFTDSVIFRYYGDSFVVYTENITESRLYDMFDDLIAASGTIEIPGGENGESIGISYSAGAAYTKNGADRNVQLKDYFITADKALCAAKKDGGSVMYAEKIIF